SMQNVLESKEFELVEAKLEIQHLKSEQAFLKVSLKEKEAELSQARGTLDEVNQEILNLKTLLSKKDNNLTETTTILKEKEEHIEKMQHDLNETNLKYSEATTAVERIVELTNLVINSMGYEDNASSKEKQLETELDVVRETLRLREMEVLQSQRAITIKENELKMVLEKLDEREKEMMEMKQELTEDAEDLRKLYARAQERIEMSRELLRTTNLVLDADYDLDISSRNIPKIEVHDSEDQSFAELKIEVARLSDFTQKLIQDAGIGEDYGVVYR
ncbi:hypothetical protein Tco_1513332, partial [Tanacetum coccineum]